MLMVCIGLCHSEVKSETFVLCGMRKAYWLANASLIIIWELIQSREVNHVWGLSPC